MPVRFSLPCLCLHPNTGDPTTPTPGLPIHSPLSPSCQLRDAALAALEGASLAGVVVLAGTDTLEELAFALHLMCGTALLRLRLPLVLTGAMLPSDQLGSDNAKNLRDALLVSP